MFPSFANAVLLAGLVGIAAPILIHLLLRRKSQRMRFSTVQFFVKRDEQSMRKRKLRNLLLLAMRVCLFALIVLAFARPFLRNLNAAGSSGKRQQLILLLDTSASMQANGLGGQQWNRAKQFARNLLSKLRADDRAALVTSSTHSSTASEFVPPSVLLQKLDAIEPTYGAGEVSEGLQQAGKLLAVSDPARETTLQIISDLQRSAAQNIGTTPLPQKLGVKMYDPGERFIPNVAVTDLQLESQNSARVMVTSFSDENYRALPFKLRIDGKEISSGEMALSA
ncbi:MAG TPA: BatA and WFA domain-containing protein, partial [Verrucomicrobiae bacterium]|nr:BatA and WFA domain-containing protein [Verrucomicrobiae bacterium]